MSNEITAGVVLKTKFVDKDTKVRGKTVETFAGYIKYIDRNEAIRNQNFSSYNLFTEYADGYMNNPDKTSGLFDAYNERLSKEQLASLKSDFQKSFDNSGIMWQTVISFDNRFLVQLGIYDPETGILDEGILHAATRRMMEDALKQEGMTHTAVWTAAIHYNTDNIHIHIAYTEPSNTRPIKVVDGKEVPKGYFSAKTLRSMKSKVVNTLLGNEYTLLDKLVREKFVAGKKSNLSFEDRQLRDLWFRIYDNLPEDKRQWFYNMNGISSLRGLLDELTLKYLTTYHKAEYLQFQKLVLKQQAVYKTAYGEKSHFNNYAKNKMRDLYTRMGNAILSEMRHYARSPYDMLYKMNNTSEPSTKFVLGRLKSALRSALDEAHRNNDMEHQQLEAQIQYGG